jgi:DNA-binding CsgD family transcriptional regulator
VFVGRRSECETLDRLLEDARAGRSGVLVMRGEPGVGKTALLEYAIDSAADLRVARAVGVESEMELAYAALHQVCAPMLDRLERLPAPQRDALGTAFGLSAGTTPDRFLVSLAVLSLLSEAAETQPLVCLIDDAQWLDRASAKAFAFVARRLLAESVAIVFAAREPIDELRGLRELVVGGLRDSDARELLAFAVRGPLDEQVRERVVAETRGNPLALLELPRGLEAAELAGGFGLPGARPLPHRIEESFMRRLEALPDEARLLLLVAAAEPVGDPALLWRAARELRTVPEALQPAMKDGLVEIDHSVRFRHPLVRSAVYRDASPADRRSVHAALAEATDPDVDPDRRAWHCAQAIAGTDEAVAAELEQSAGRAQGRGGVAAAAAFLERAVGLTADPARRAQRALAAAQATHLAGAPDAALELLATAREGRLDELGLARMDTLRAQIAYSLNRAGDAPRLLLRAAKRLEPLDVTMARETYLDALSAAWYLGRLASGSGVPEVAQAVLSAPQPHSPRAFDLLLDGVATRFTAGSAAGASMLKRALAAFPSEDISSVDALRWLWLAVVGAVAVWDDRSWEALATRWVQLARQTGVLPVLPLALNGRIAACTFAGDLAAAASLIEEAQAVSEAIGSHVPPYGALFLAGRRGREAEATPLIEATVKEALERGEGYAVSAAEWARALLYNGLGRYEDALGAAERASAHPEDLWFHNFGLVELIEAAVRNGNAEHAADALERLSEITRAGGTDWALGVEARSRALLNEGEAAERLYGEAIDRLSRTRVRAELGRAHLLFGEWLRRERRRLDAREQLRTAHEMFIGMGVEAFAERAERELLATGERARKRTVETREDLTAQEAQIARLAGEGFSNPEIGARLFISPKTVEYHLRKVFSKLGITSRTQLDRALPQRTDVALRV